MAEPATEAVAEPPEPPEAASLRAWVADRGEVVESLAVTHISVIALTAAHAYKMKRPVRFAFIDQSTAARRRDACLREVALNRRLAPDVYLDVEALHDRAGVIIDHVVVMRRMSADHRLANIARRGSGVECVTRVAEQLAAFHATARRSPEIDRLADRDAIRALWAEGFSQWTPFVGSLLDRTVAERVEALVDRYLSGRAPLFDERIAKRRIVDGHGDLLADDIYCEASGPRILDCLEFDDRLRGGDVLADSAFLAMDLERVGRADLAEVFLQSIAELEHDHWPRSLEHHYVAYRAHVRAKVASLRHADRGDAASAAEAAALLALAQQHLEAGRVRIVLIGGLPGSGKTTLAVDLAHALGGEHLRSDAVRKERAGVAAGEHRAAPFGAGLYDAATTEATYAALLDEARHHVERGRSVVLDASWSDPQRRNDAAALAAATAADLVAFECRAPRSIIAKRLTARLAAGTDASDADLAVHDAMARRFAPWPEAVAVDAGGNAADAVRAAVAVLGGS